MGGKERAQSVEYWLMLVFSVMAEEANSKKGKKMLSNRATATIFDDFSVYVYDFSFPELIIQETKLEKGWNGY